MTLRSTSDMIRRGAYGTMEFWRRVSKLFASTKKRGYLSYEQIDQMLEAAVESGAVTAWDDSSGKTRISGPFTMAFYRLWKAAKEAREQGVSAKDFWEQYNRKIDAAIESGRIARERAEHQAAQRIANASAELRERRNGKGRPKARYTSTEEADAYATAYGNE